MNGETTLYRLYAADGVLLYVGISNNWPHRMKQHQRDKSWWGEVRNVSTQTFATRKEAERAEAAAIRNERPSHNVKHRERQQQIEGAIRWYCDECGRETSDGYIQLLGAERRRYDQEWQEWGKTFPEGQHTGPFLNWDAFWARPQPAHWQVVCADCDPDKDGGGYWIHLQRAATWRELVMWTSHLMGKAWLDQTDWDDLLERTATKR